MCPCFSQDLSTLAGAGGAQGAAPGALPTAPRRRVRAKYGAKTVGVGQRSKERTLQDRYTDVEAFWKSLKPEQRRELLTVPLTSLLQSGCNIGLWEWHMARMYSGKLR